MNARLVSRVAAFAVFVIAATTITGSCAGVSALSTWGGDTAMALTTGLCFFALSVALFFRNMPALSTACATFAASIGMLTLMEYALMFDLGVSSALSEYALLPTSAMAPNTALSFALVGVSMLYHRTAFVAVVALSAPFTLSALALFGHIAGVESFYRFHGETGMAVPTATAFLIFCSARFYKALAGLKKSRIATT
jgi:hypothetical protein